MLPQAPGTSVHIVASPFASGSGDPAVVATITFRASARFVLLSPTPSPNPNASPTPSPSPTASPLPPYRYAIIDLGKDLHPRRINNQGWILLNGYDADGNWSSYRWKGGTLERLDYSGPYSNLVAADMNDTGAAVGSFSYEGPWGAATERETGGGLFWPPGRSTADKLSGSGSYPGFGRAAGLSFRVAGASAVNNANDTFGTMCTGTVQGFLFSTLLVMNSAEWSSGSGSAVQLSNAAASNGDGTTFFPFWGGSIDTISRANAAGHYIGSKLTNLFANPFGVSGTTTGMIDGQSVSFSPIDINEAGIVVGSAGADMVVSSSPNSQATISGASPLAINDHTRPAPSPSGQSSPAPNPSPTPIPVPQILAWAGEAIVMWERQDDGQTWHPFGLEEMIPTMDGWQYLEPYDMNDAGAIIGRGWYTDPSIPGAQGEFHAFLLIPVAIVYAPLLKDDTGQDVTNSDKSSSIGEVSEVVKEPRSGQIPNVAYRIVKVRVPELMEGETVRWSMTPQFTPDGEAQPRFRGHWPQEHPDRFEPADAENYYLFERSSEVEGRTTIDNDGETAVRLNIPSIGFNKARVKMDFENHPGAFVEIDFEVPAVVVIDPGHGGTSDLPGSDANHAVSPTNVKEKDLALSYGLALREALETKVQQDKLNVKVLMTRKVDENVSGTDRAHFARDNGADAVFVIHFNSSNGSVRGTLEVRQVPSQVNLNEDFALIDPIVNSVVAAIIPFDSGARKLEFFPRDTSVAFDPKLGNTAAYHPIRVGYCEVEFLDNAAVDVLLNTGPNAGAVKTAIVNAMRDGILNDLRNQPAAP
jgi:N-acetylmuramoyl-L-alanine amidase